MRSTSLKVPAEDRIAIVKELYKTGKLHAKLIDGMSVGQDARDVTNASETQ